MKLRISLSLFFSCGISQWYEEVTAVLLRIDVFFLFIYFFEKIGNRRKCLNTKLGIKISVFFLILTK